MGWPLEGRQLFSWTQGQEISRAARRSWNQDLESHSDSLPVSSTMSSLCTSTQSPLFLCWPAFFDHQSRSHDYRGLLRINGTVQPRYSQPQFKLPGLQLWLAQLELLLEVRGMFNQVVLGTISSELGSPVMRVTINWADTPKCVHYTHLCWRTNQHCKNHYDAFFYFLTGI